MSLTDLNSYGTRTLLLFKGCSLILNFGYRIQDFLCLYPTSDKPGHLHTTAVREQKAGTQYRIPKGHIQLNQSLSAPATRAWADPSE